MIRDNFKRGDRLPSAEYYNAVARAANMVSGYKSSVFNTSEANRNMLMGQVVIDVINKTALPLPSFSVLEIDNPRWRDGQDILSDVRSLGILYAGETPSGDEGKTAVITLDTLAPDEINRAVIMGIVPCMVDVSDISHRFAKPAAGSITHLQSSDSGNIRLVLHPIQTGEQVLDVMLGFGGGGGGGAHTPTETYASVVLPICRAINPHAQGDWNIPFGNVFQTQYNSRSHFAAASGFVAIDGKTYFPVIDHTDPDGTVYYRKALRVRGDVNFDCFGDSGIDGANAQYTIIGKLQRPVIEYVDGDAEWTPWEEDFTWQTTTDESIAWNNYDIAACKTLDYSEVLVPGERVKVLSTETHNFYNVASDALVAESKTVTIVEPPANYTVQFEGCAAVDEFGVWNKERQLTNNNAYYVRTTIDTDYVIGQGTEPYLYWGFDVVPLLPNGNASWTFVDIAAFPTLAVVNGTGTCYNTNHVSRPELSNDVFIQNTACNTRAYGLWYKTDRDGLRYPILCSVTGLPFGRGIMTRERYCQSDCTNSWLILDYEIVRNGNRLALPQTYCDAPIGYNS